MGRPKKKSVELPQEIKEVVNKVLQEEKFDKVTEDDHRPQVLWKNKKEHKIEWDFPIDKTPDFFDTNYSYEITGYRPINKTQGLDFDPTVFYETREVFNRTGSYTAYPRNSRAFGNFWDNQYLRCRNGLTVDGYTITGDHYFFLNFYQLQTLSNTTKIGTARTRDFPNFFVAQYEYFHYIEMCKVTKQHAILMKARGVGFSEMDAATATNNYNARRTSKTVVTANSESHLENTLEKIWNAIDFINVNTGGGFLKLSQVVDNQWSRRASHYQITEGQKAEVGWKSEITGIIADNPRKIRGDRVDILIYEEFGSWPNSKKAFIQGDPLVNIQGQRFGLKIAGGTGGDTGPYLEGLRDIYYSPKSYGVLPYRHKYTNTGEEILTGFFIPAYKVVNTSECIDHRGYTDEEKGKEYYEREKALRADDPKSLLIYCAEYCFNAEEAFSLQGENKFDKNKIADQLARITILKETPKIDQGYLEFTYRNGIHTPENISGIKWIERANSPLQILEHPVWTLPDKKDPNTGQFIPTNKEKINNLYVIGIDGIDIGMSQTSSYTKDPSDFCLVVKKRAFGMSEPTYVAIYKDRPHDIREAYKMAIKIAIYYNARINIEATRQSIIPWARDRKFLHYFMQRPTATLTDIKTQSKRASRTYGTPATSAIIAHQTDLIADYVMDYCHNIWFYEILDELNRYSDEAKRKFDIIAAMGMAELADEELSGVVPYKKEELQIGFKKLGYYTDEFGNRRYGLVETNPIIPIGNPQFNHTYEHFGVRTSDTRYYS